MTPNPVIAKCPDDILLTIFLLNSIPQFPESALQFTPLTLTRFTSQVCRHWRLLVLGSPLLWGRLLDLSDLDQKSDHWRNEVLLRTEQAYLHVKVILDPHLPQITSFFFKIIDEEWSRIQDLSTSIYQFGDFDDDRWLAIHRPTDTLRSFYLHFGSQLQPPKPLRSANGQFFSHYAPSLRYLTIHWMTFQLPPKWFPQLHSLDLVGQFQPLLLLSSLSQDVPLTESLSVHGLVDSYLDSESDDSCPTTHFPRLQALTLKGDLVGCLRFLEHIMIPEGCSLSLSISDRHSIPSTSSIFRVISRFSERFHKFHTQISVLVEVSGYSFSYQTEYPMTFEDPIFFFEIKCSKPFLKSRCFEALLGCPLSQVARLSFETDHRSGLSPSDSKFLKFIALFSSVTEITSTLETLLLLVKAGIYTSDVVLPALKVLEPILDSEKPEIVQAISTFLDWRQAIDLPIEFLDLRDDIEGQYFNFGELEQFSGMKVEWTTVNKKEMYICGSGNAHQLDFGTPPPVRGSSDVDNDSEPDSDDSFE